MKRITLALFCFLLFCTATKATTIYINDANFTSSGWCTAAGNDGTGNGTTAAPYATLTKALSVASAGDIIRVDAGLYLNQSAITVSLAGITIVGHNNSSAIFSLTAGTANFLTLNANNITISDIAVKGYNSNTALQGKAITVTDVFNTLIYNVYFDSCVSASGGEAPLYISTASNQNSNTTVRKCSFIGNTGNYGGGIDVCSNTNNGAVTNVVTIDSCYFENNGKNLFNGGALLIYNGASSGGSTKAPQITLTNSTFGNLCTGNKAMRGGAVYIDNGAGLTANNNCFLNNQAIDVTGPDGGGAIWIGAASTNINDCKFENNSANIGTSKYGGGIYVNSGFSSGNLLVNRCAFINNLANRGAGIYVDNVNVNILNSLFYGNAASGASSFGGGVAVDDVLANVTMYNCTFSKNSTTSAGRGEGIDANVGNFNSFDIKNSIIYGNGTQKEIAGGTNINVSWSIIGTNSTAGTDYTSVTGNSSANPLFTNSGGNDFTLSGTGSPAYNTGNADGGSAPIIDINSLSRPQFDMGCYALNSSPILKWTCPNLVSIAFISGNTNVICPGQSVVLTAMPSSGFSYSWTSVPAGFTATTATVSVSPTVTTVYQVQITNTTTACGSYGSASYIVSMGAGPVVIIKPDYDSICSGQIMSITGGGASTYTWTANPGTISSTTGTIITYTAPTTSVTLTSTITAIGTDSAGCVSVAPSVLTLTVNPLPVVTAYAISTSLCSGDTSSLFSSGANTYTWTVSTGTLSVTNGNQTVYTSPTVTTVTTVTVTVMGTSVFRCAGVPFTFTLSVNPIPVVTTTVSSTTICSGTIATFTAGGASTYTWSASSGSFSSTSGSPISYTSAVVAVPTTVTITVNGTSSAGCLNAAATTFTVLVNPLPVVTATAVANTLCSGANTTVSASGANTYTWTASSGTVNPVNGTPAIYTAPSSTLASTETITLNGSNAFGCANATPVTLTITINPMPVLNVSVGTATLCSGATTTLTASGANTFTWSASQGTLSSVTGSALSYTAPTVGGITTVSINTSGTGAGGCSSTPTSITLTVNPIPTITAAANNTVICSGTTTTLTASGAANYTWTSSSGSLSSANGNPIVFTAPVTAASNTITILVNGSIGAGCSSTSPGTVSVIINPEPPTQIVTPAAVICSGNSTTLVANGATSYTWTATSGTVTPANGNLVNYISPTTTVVLTVTVSVVGSNGTCANSSPIVTTVTVNPVTIPVITPSGPLGLCNGTSVVLTSNPGTGIIWNTGASTPSITVSTSGSFTVVATNSFGCSAASSIITTTLFPASPAPLITSAGANSFCQGDSVELWVNQSNGVIWQPGGQTNDSIYINVAGTYTVTYTDINNCPSLPAITVINSNPAPVFNYTTMVVIPAHCSHYDGAISGITISNGNGPYTYYWHDSTGAIIQTGNISLPNQMPGTYSLEVTDIYGCHATSNTETIPNLPGIQVVLTGTPLIGDAPLTVNFTAQTSINNPSGGFAWNYGAGNQIITSGNQTQYTYATYGTYNAIVAVVDSFGCVAKDTIQIIANEIVSIVIPNIFTPNGDGINDGFSIITTGISNLDISIYTRWGEILAEKSGPSIYWDGETKNGIKASEGTYYYVLAYTTKDGHTINTKGFITLTR